MNFREPSKLEMQVLSVLWARGASTVRDVMEVMPDGKTRAYTTILSVMQVMEKKGLVSHTTEGNVHVYQARVSRQKIAGPLLKGLVRQLFGGSAASVLQHLLAEERVSREELNEIKEIISQHEPGGGGSGSAVRKVDKTTSSSRPSPSIWKEKESAMSAGEELPIASESTAAKLAGKKKGKA